jgi:hypothetical protein
VYQKNDDESVGMLVGKIEESPLGKTKVKWFKSNT